MEEQKLVFKLSSHRKLWTAMPEYILKIVRDGKEAINMSQVVSLARSRALTDLFPTEGYVVYDCFACQYTKLYGELYLEDADEKCCKYCPLDWGNGIKCGYRGNFLYLLEHLDLKRLNEKRVRNLCKKISEIPAKEGVDFQ